MIDLSKKPDESPHAKMVGKALDNVRIAIKACERAGKVLEDGDLFGLEVDIRGAANKLRVAFDRLIEEYQRA